MNPKKSAYTAENPVTENSAVKNVRKRMNRIIKIK